MDDYLFKIVNQKYRSTGSATQGLQSKIFIEKSLREKFRNGKLRPNKKYIRKIYWIIKLAPIVELILENILKNTLWLRHLRVLLADTYREKNIKSPHT